jgi:taurine--2-oxoglutarate transaminase
MYTMTHWNAFVTNPPLCITETQLRDAFDIIDRALDVADSAVS